MIQIDSNMASSSKSKAMTVATVTKKTILLATRMRKADSPNDKASNLITRLNSINIRSTVRKVNLTARHSNFTGLRERKAKAALAKFS